ncbi:hypothetical protein [Tetragenococcus halophilus]|uniref:hypothetical protein n=2 Tax=Tetragenococcus halophilus TaxID=51669 RepID=UPI0030F2FA04
MMNLTSGSRYQKNILRTLSACFNARYDGISDDNIVAFFWYLEQEDSTHNLMKELGIETEGDLMTSLLTLN